jgi:hypothetical protein
MENARVQRIIDMLDEMALYDRKTFDRKLTEKIVGSLGEYIKYKTALLNGEKEWTDHWKTEIIRLIGVEAKYIYLSPIKGFKDKEAVLKKSIQDVKHEDMDRPYASQAERVFKSYYHKVPKKVVSKEDLNIFFDSIEGYLTGDFKKSFDIE